MRVGIVAACLVVMIPAFAAAQPDMERSDLWSHFEGTISQSEIDTGTEFLDAAMPDGWSCTTSIDSVLLVLRIPDASPSDRVRLDGYSWIGPATQPAYALGKAPAILYAQDPSGCVEFAIEGERVASTVRYVLEVHHCPLLVLCSGV